MQVIMTWAAEVTLTVIFRISDDELLQNFSPVSLVSFSWRKKKVKIKSLEFQLNICQVK